MGREAPNEKGWKPSRTSGPGKRKMACYTMYLKLSTRPPEPVQSQRKNSAGACPPTQVAPQAVRLLREQAIEPAGAVRGHGLHVTTTDQLRCV